MSASRTARVSKEVGTRVIRVCRMRNGRGEKERPHDGRDDGGG